MQYIHLSNDSYIIKTSKGAHTLTRESFNFNKVKRLLSNNAEESVVLPLLATPLLPDGIYKAYVVPSGNEMYYIHFKETPNQELLKECKQLDGSDATSSEADKLVGVYASKEDLILDWPEYTI
jgi:hypothetical protein